MPFSSPTDEQAQGPCPRGLYVVATPIGNLEDITFRAIRILSQVDLIAAEDTRHTARLLSRYEIRTPLVSCHEHNEVDRVPELIRKIEAGAAVAVVSDAGTPSVSDPGYRLVRAAAASDLNIYPIPGVTAAMTALSASGLPTDTFVFFGFVPKKEGKRKELLRSAAAESRTMVFYESPRRIVGLLDSLLEMMGDRPAVLAREMTKIHEEFIRGSLSTIRRIMDERQAVKGECTLLVGGKKIEESEISTKDLREILRHELARPEGRVSHLSKKISKQYGLPRKKVYDMALALKRAADTEKDADR